MEVADGVDSESKIQQRRMRRVGLLYDERMCKHSTPDGGQHPENPDRIKVIWNKLQAAAIPQRCVILGAKEAEDKHILSVHSKNHVNLIKNISSKQFDSRRNRVASKFNSIYFNEGSSEAAYLAVGSAIEVTERVAKGELDSAVAIIRPPGHHAEQDEAMGFCLYNNVAIAARFLLDEKPELGISKILIVDWDVHHGNGTQKMFWKDPRVLFFSVHRHEFGSFYPATDDGFYTMIGEGPGAGYNINVPWENGRCGDADYFAVWDHILVPVAKEFNPDLIIVSAGFDAAAGDPLGGGCVTPYGYAVMLKKLMNFAHGKIVLALEGGYNLESVANSVLACVEVLLEDNPIRGSSEAYPFESTWRVIQAVRQKLSSFWPSLADELPEKLTNKKAPPAAPSNLPARDAPWNGGFILDAATPGEFIGGFQARPPCKVHPKAYAFSQKMPLIVNANWLPRSSIWTDIFQDNDPVLEDVALYFFPDENIERSRENHARLINRMENQNSMIRICFDGKGMELLIFTSGSLQLDSRVADFVWGIFRCIKKDVAHNKVPEGLPSTVDQENVDDNKIVDMEVDMVGGKMVGRVDRVVPRDSKVIWNTKSSSEMKTRCGLQKNLGKEEGKIPPETEEEESAGPPGFS